MSLLQQLQSKASRIRFSSMKRSTLASWLVVFLLVIIALACAVVSCTANNEIVLTKEDTAFVAQTNTISEGEDNSSTDSNEQAFDGEGDSSDADSGASSICVYVSGCVANPGVYTLSESDRVADAVTAAGGPLPEAELDLINLARKLVDGEQVHIPSAEDASVGYLAAANDSAASPVVSKVNINTAGVEELMALDGIGESTANKIIDDRTTNGPFATIDDIKRVSGIGDKKFEAIKDDICA